MGGNSPSVRGCPHSMGGTNPLGFFSPILLELTSYTIKKLIKFSFLWYILFNCKNKMGEGNWGELWESG